MVNTGGQETWSTTNLLRDLIKPEKYVDYFLQEFLEVFLKRQNVNASLEVTLSEDIPEILSLYCPREWLDQENVSHDQQ